MQSSPSRIIHVQTILKLGRCNRRRRRGCCLLCTIQLDGVRMPTLPTILGCITIERLRYASSSGNPLASVRGALYTLLLPCHDCFAHIARVLSIGTTYNALAFTFLHCSHSRSYHCPCQPATTNHRCTVSSPMSPLSFDC